MPNAPTEQDVLALPYGDTVNALIVEGAPPVLDDRRPHPSTLTPPPGARILASQCREAAETATTLRARTMLLRLAHFYEEWADDL